MTRDRIIQIIALLVIGASVAGSSMLLPGILRETERRALRYTDVSVEGAPPFVALGTAMGALRGIIVDYLWIKVNIMKERGLFYEVMADAELITKLQPRFAGVWAFHGHNMAYNISVATHTEEERWEWVNAGIRLVRNEGLRHNPNSLLLHKELAFWFAHKIDGLSDDGHLYYKRMFCQEWHGVLGEPPESHEERIAWINVIADAPSTLDDAERRTPGVKALVERLNAPLIVDQPGFQFKLDGSLLREYAAWQAVKGQSTIARMLGIEDQIKTQPRFIRINDLATDPGTAEAWETLIAHVRKRVLIDEYNMDPQLMHEYTRDLGPLDWRHPEAHALYWSRRGSQLGQARVSEYDVYHVLNNDRLQIQAMQGMARSGRIQFDPFSTEIPGRLPDPRWIDPIDQMFDYLYAKHIDVQGAGGETFIAFLQNFLGSSVCMWYRAGETEKAQQLMDRLDQLFGTGAQPPNHFYQVPLDVFVRRETFDQYELQPHLAPRDVNAALRHGLVGGIARGRPEVYKNALSFARQVTEFFQNADTNDFNTKFGSGRLRDMLGALEQSTRLTLGQVMVDRSLPLDLRMTIWSQIDKHDKTEFLRQYVYTRIKPVLEDELAMSAWGQRFTINQVLPEPPAMDAYRVWEARRQAAARQGQDVYAEDVARDGDR